MADFYDHQDVAAIYRAPKINTWALPLAFGVSYIIYNISVFRILSAFLSIIQLHEMGHVLAA